jgi:hypothetical protein
MVRQAMHSLGDVNYKITAFSSPIKHSFYQISFYLKIFVLINAIN